MSQTTGTMLNPVGHELGGLVATLVQNVIDIQGESTRLSINGIQGTNPAIFVTPQNAAVGIKSVKKYIDYYTGLGFDDGSYPDAPLGYEYHMRGSDFIWRKQRQLTGTPVARFTVGKDAILSGDLTSYPVFTDFHVTANDTSQSYALTDKDTIRRWGGRRFWGQDNTASSFMSDAYALAVRSLELFKLERISFSLVIASDAYLLYPGDIVAVYGGESEGIVSGNYRVSEVQIEFGAAMRTKITVGDPAKLLSDFF